MSKQEKSNRPHSAVNGDVETGKIEIYFSRIGFEIDSYINDSLRIMKARDFAHEESIIDLVDMVSQLVFDNLQKK